MFRMRSKPVRALFLGWSTGLSGCGSTRVLSDMPKNDMVVTVRFSTPQSLVARDKSAARPPIPLDSVVHVQGSVVATRGDTVVLRLLGATHQGNWISNVDGLLVDIPAARAGTVISSTASNTIGTVVLILLGTAVLFAYLFVTGLEDAYGDHGFKRR